MSRLLTTKRARRLRADQTRAEAHLWSALRDRRLGGWKWRRQVPCGPYIADFLCIEVKLVVELDGSQHIDAKNHDDQRTAYLAAQGLQVIRFWNSFVLEHRSDACDAIIVACGGARDELSRTLSRSRERMPEGQVRASVARAAKPLAL